MRDIKRSRMAAATKSRRATPEELREARNRVKEIDTELRQLELSPETTRGEDRERRYERALRLRQMREEFTSRYPALEPQGMNGPIMAVAMTIMTFLACFFCASGAYFSYSALTYNPGPGSVASSFWSDIQSQGYQDAYSNMLSPSLRAAVTLQQFLGDAQQADTDYGPVVSETLTSQSVDAKNTNAKLVYKVTRQKKGGALVTYTTTLQMSLLANVWGITDLGAAIYPEQGGAKPVPGETPTASPSATP